MTIKLDITNKKLLEISKNYENLKTAKGYSYSPTGQEILILTSYNSYSLIKNKLYIYDGCAVLEKYR